VRYSKNEIFSHRAVRLWERGGIDRKTEITGSFNFTKAAEEKNAENLLIIKSRELAGIYIENWKKHLEQSGRYEARY
jgi:phosphatidylserine/phosphatidylglycerophosphate/cardiolipin synthase-like enzyme